MSTIVDPSEIILELGLSATITAEETAIIAQAVRKAEGSVKRYLNYDPVQAVRTEFYPVRQMVPSRRATVWEADSSQAFLRRQSGSGVDTLQVRHLPIRTTDSDGENAIDLRVTFDGRFGTRSGSFAEEDRQVEGTDYWPAYDTVDSGAITVCHSGLIRSIGRWPIEPGSIKIVYVGGYTATELRGTDGTLDASPIWSAVLDEVRRKVIKAFSLRKHAVAGFVGAPMESERLGDYNYKLNTSMLMAMIGGNWDLLAETRQALDQFVNYGVAIAS